MYFFLVKPAGNVLFALSAVADRHAGERLNAFRNVQQCLYCLRIVRKNRGPDRAQAFCMSCKQKILGRGRAVLHGITLCLFAGTSWQTRMATGALFGVLTFMDRNSSSTFPDMTTNCHACSLTAEGAFIAASSKSWMSLSLTGVDLNFLTLRRVLMVFSIFPREDH